MSRNLKALLMAGALAVAAALARDRWAQRPGIAMPGDDPAALVEFSCVETANRDASARSWEATFPGRSGTAHFDIVMEVRAPRPGDQHAFTKGSFRARQDSKPDDLLKALARAHHATRRVRNEPRARDVSFSTAILGMALSRGRGTDILAGEFTSKPQGPWIVAKIFLPPADAEIFVAVDPSARVGLFLPKDDEYWGDLEPVLASVP
jgi:hypothetical protein